MGWREVVSAELGIVIITADDCLHCIELEATLNEQPLDVPNLLQLLRPRGRLVLARPPRISADFFSLFRQQLTVLPSAAASVRSGLEALVQGTLRADGLAERVLALNEVAHWWNQPRARTLVRIGATQ